MDWASLRRAGTERITLPYAEAGTGEPVVLVHGSNSDHRIWDRHQSIIGSRHRAIALSQRYFGGDAWLDGGEQFNISVLADDLAAFVHGLEVGPVTIVGWSFGGAVSLVMAVRNPMLVRRMFLYEPSLTTFVTDPGEARAALEDRSAQSSTARQLIAAGDLTGAVRALMDGVNGEAGAFDRLSPEVQAMMIENARMLALLFAAPPPPSVSADDLRALDFPVTIAVGSNSRTNYRIAARAAQALIPDARLVIVDRAKHLWPIEDPAAFSWLVLEALGRA